MDDVPHDAEGQGRKGKTPAIEHALQLVDKCIAKVGFSLIRHKLEQRGGVGRVVFTKDDEEGMFVGHPSAYSGLEGFREVRLSCSNDEVMAVWYKPAEGDKHTQVMFHGRGGDWGPRLRLIGVEDQNLFNRIGWLEETAKTGCGVVVFHTPGVGRNGHISQDITEVGMQKIYLPEIVRFLEQEGIPPEKTFAIGESNGGAMAAIFTQVHEQERGEFPRGLAIINSYPNFADAAYDRLDGFVKRLLGRDAESGRARLNEVFENAMNTGERLQSFAAAVRPLQDLLLTFTTGDPDIRAGSAQSMLTPGVRAGINVQEVDLKALGVMDAQYEQHSGWNPGRLAELVDKWASGKQLPDLPSQGRGGIPGF